MTIPPKTDSADYAIYAWNIKYSGTYSRSTAGIAGEGSVSPDSVRYPGYPVFLVSFVDRELTRDFVWDVRVAQATLMVVSVLLLFLICRQFMPYWPALGAMFLAAISPHLVNSTIYVLTETLFTFSLLLVLITTKWFIWHQKVATAILLGVVMGIASLIRPSLMLFPVALGVFYFLTPRMRTRMGLLAIMLMGFVIVFGSWIGRNQSITGQIDQPNLSVTFIHHGIYPGMMYGDHPATLGYPYLNDPQSEEIGQSFSAVLSELWRRFMEEPGRHLSWYLIGKPKMFWSWNIVAGMGDAFIYPVQRSPYASLIPFTLTHWIAKQLHWVSVIFAGVACIIVWKPDKGLESENGSLIAQICALMLLYFTALHMIGAPFPRYSIPLRPELYAMAAYCVYRIWGYFGRGCGNLGLAQRPIELIEEGR